MSWTLKKAAIADLATERRGEVRGWAALAPYALICGLSAMLLWSHILYGYPDGHSANLNIPWFHFFLQQLQAGDLYPRWLLDYPEGLGAPVFYFYAPAPFYLSAAVGTFFCWDCNSVQMLSLGHWAILSLSGLAFRAWAMGLMGRWPALLAALVYMLLPYHFFDSEIRDALGESMAYVWLPLIFLGLSNLRESGRHLLLAGGAYGGLILSHLPSALLATPMMIVYCAALTGRRSGAPVMLLRLAAVGLSGLALGAVYILPALTMRDLLPADAWVRASGPLFFPERWLLWGPHGSFDLGRDIYGYLALSTLLALAGVLTLLHARLRGEQAGLTVISTEGRTVLAGVIVLALCWAMMSGLSTWLWVHVDILRQVQFPWRLGPIVDFWGASLFAMGLAQRLGDISSPESGRGKLRTLLLSCLVLAILASAPFKISLLNDRIMKRDAWTDADPTRFDYPIEYRPKWVVESAVYRAGALDVPEKGLATTELKNKAGKKRWLAHVGDLPQIALEGEGRGGTVEMRAEGANAFAIAADLPAPARVILRRVYFPHWRLRDMESGDEIALAPTAEAGLVSFRLPAGTHHLGLDERRTFPEIIGGTISAAAVLILLLFALRGPWRLRRQAD